MSIPKLVPADFRRSLIERVTALLEASDVKLDRQSKEATPLISSGKLDSQGLFNLVLFIENEIGRQIDVLVFNLAEEWNTINDIVNFIVRQRACA